MVENLKIENLICSFCNKTSLNDCIFCDLCSTWLHRTCLELAKSSLSTFSSSPHPWFCSKCTEYILPFQSLTNQAFSKLFLPTTNLTQTPHTAYCSTCNKSKNSPLILCTIGKHYCHLSCINSKPNHVKEFKKLTTHIWSCHDCLHLPFGNINNTTLLKETFNSLTYQNNNNNINRTNKINHTENFNTVCSLPKLELADPLNNNLNLCHNFSYFKTNDFRVIIKQQITNNNKSFLSFFHTNITSIVKNFDELSCLMLSLIHI